MIFCTFLYTYWVLQRRLENDLIIPYNCSSFSSHFHLNFGCVWSRNLPLFHDWWLCNPLFPQTGNAANFLKRGAFNPQLLGTAWGAVHHLRSSSAARKPIPSFLPKRGLHHQSLDFLARQGVKIIINYGYQCRLEFFLNQRISLSRESLVKEWTLTQCFCCCKPLATGGRGCSCSNPCFCSY